MWEYLTRYWWVLGARAGAALGFATMVIAWPSATVLAIAIIFGLYAISEAAVIAAGAAFRAPSGIRPALFAEALVGAAFGIVSLAWPSATVRVITILFGLWAIITGVGELAVAVRVRKEVADEPTYILLGGISILIGVIVMASPVHRPITVAWLLGICAGVYGFLMIAASARLKVIATGEPPPG